ncbi:hypothetical protein Fmac_026042 [Flemingia macrophylla]|uniref:DUF4378 domain-containing protein n=1 Tax=Flemingia macrophylla TaxID=520843 RepID=A0ABD1LEA4_9FABA
MASSGGKALCNNHSPKRSVLLKDYLRDDLSSCSSNGFKSFPRQQCCSTVRFQRPRSGGSSYSALQRASRAIMNAVKSRKNDETKKGSSGFLSRSFSRKVLGRSFWRKATRREQGSEGVPRRRRSVSFRELIMQEREEHLKATSLNKDTVTVFTSMITTTSSGCGSDSWGESEFTFASSESSNETYLLPEGAPAPHHHKVVEQVPVTKEYLANEKEQFSPVSILDCPFEDEEDIYKSRFNSTSNTLSFSEGNAVKFDEVLQHINTCYLYYLSDKWNCVHMMSLITGAKHKHMQKRSHFERVAKLKPVDLEKRFAFLELEDEPHNHSCLPKNCNNMCRGNIDENARDLVNFVKRSTPSNGLTVKAESLLFDFFKHSIGESGEDVDHSKKFQLCKVAEDWIRGQPQEMYLGWEVDGGRCVYISEMDKCWEKKSDKQVQQLAMELANEVFENLVNEFVLDLTNVAGH